MITIPSHPKPHKNPSGPTIDIPLKSTFAQDTPSPHLNPNFQNPITPIPHENRLPINLLHSTTQYNKLIITNGRNIKNVQQPQISGFGNNTLQWMNQQIYQYQQKQRLSMKLSQKNMIRTQRKQRWMRQQCGCCCCENYCSLCANTHKTNQYNKLTEQQLQKVLKKLTQNPPKHRKKYGRPSQKTQNNKSPFTQQKSYLSQYHLSSQFSQPQHKINHKKNSNILLKKLDEEIRLQNKLSGKKCIQKIGSKSNRSLLFNKNNVRMEYWKSVKGTIAKSLDKDKTDKNHNKSPNKITKITNDCQHKIHLSPEQMKHLALKHEQQAKQVIALQSRQTQSKKKNIEQNLKKLERHRVKHLKKCQKVKFQPSPQMINQAFKNIILFRE